MEPSGSSLKQTMELTTLLSSTFTDRALPNPERDDIAQTTDMAARAMKLYLSSLFNPLDPEWAALSDDLTAETAGVWGHNLQVRKAELLALGKEGMAKLAKKRAKAPIDPMNNLFLVFEE
jgi:hypothetical protein